MYIIFIYYMQTPGLGPCCSTGCPCSPCTSPARRRECSPCPPASCPGTPPYSTTHSQFITLYLNL